MKLYEYQAMSLFERYGIPTARGLVTDNAASVPEIFRTLGKKVVVKAQVLVGGRGKAGGVKAASTPEEAKEAAGKILSMSIKKIPVKKVLISEALDIKKEFYLGLTLDRSKKKVVVITTAEGGVDIEELASKEPEKIQILPIDPLKGIDREKLDNCIGTVFNDQGMAQQAKETVLKLFKLLNENDCSLVEINPFASVGPGRLVALDAKIIIDDSSLFKHPDLASMRNEEEYTRDELEARTHGLSFVNLDGTIGCIVNGAGLAMATMDIIKLFGGSPANFLDVGGSSSPEKVVHAFDILTRNKKIKAVLINIFGGITRCDDIARGIVQAKQKMSLSLPLVIRLIGTNEKEGRTILQDAGIAAFDDLTSAVKEVVRHV